MYLLRCKGLMWTNIFKIWTNLFQIHCKKRPDLNHPTRETYKAANKARDEEDDCRCKEDAVRYDLQCMVLL